MRVVISQSMYFPWVGMLEQIRLADVFIHYDDVQFSKGSFTNRVQVKQPGGTSAWMTIPLAGLTLGQTIDAVTPGPAAQWAGKHLALLARAFDGAPHRDAALGLAETVLAGDTSTLAAVARSSMLALADHFALSASTRFLDAATMGIGGSGSRRVLDLVKAVGGDTYVTGHGARNYLDHALFEREGVAVEYIDYAKRPYPQLHGSFTPYVTGLDLVANCGAAGIGYIVSTSRHWKDFLHGT